MVKIIAVSQGSLAEKKKILPGDILLSIHDNPINDVLDYRFYLTEKKISLLIKRGEKDIKIKLKKDEYEDIGLEFETPLMDKKHTCKNGCIFCFIDQNPKGLRDTLYFKDDDSRLSFLHGNYVTLTNMSDLDVARIIKMRISPVNVSVHTTNPDLRVKMMKNKRAGEVLKYLDDFKNHGISICAQVVLCKGVNDGEELMRTMTDLSRLYPELGSVSIVPAGLTKFRDGLYPLTDYTPEEASEIIDAVQSFGDKCLAEKGSRLFFAADELYLKAGRAIPEQEYYEGYPQIENGVGLIRSFKDEADMALEELKELENKESICSEISVATGVAAYDTIKAICDKICLIAPNLKINVYKITNKFFGESITVSGLLTGKDVAEQLSGKNLGECLYLSSSCLRHGEDVFLCGMKIAELSRALGVEVCTLESDGYAFVEGMLGLSERTV